MGSVASEGEEGGVTMQASDPLVAEHRVIEKVVGAMRDRLELAATGGGIDPCDVDEWVGFLRAYADGAHYRKEEEILFHHLGSRPLSLEHRVWLEELIDEHEFTRQMTERLAEANQAGRDRDEASLAAVRDTLTMLVELLPAHMAKEETVFFPTALSYLDEREGQWVLDEFRRFDLTMSDEL